MQEVDLYSLLDCAINASIKAGDEIMKIYDSNFEFTTKKDDSPLTIADKNSNAIIEKALKISKIPFLSEEGKDIPYNERKKERDEEKEGEKKKVCACLEIGSE